MEESGENRVRVTGNTTKFGPMKSKQREREGGAGEFSEGQAREQVWTYVSLT